jgi:dolichol-phosphate mannosyltransferase
MANALMQSKIKFLFTYQFLSKFALGTIISYALNISSTFFFTEFLGVWYIYSYILTRIIQLVFTFYYNAKVIFKSKHDTSTVARFLTVVIGVDILNIGFVKILTDYANLYYLYSVTLSLIVFLILKYLLYSVYVYKK